MPVDSAFEHGVLVDTGSVTLNGIDVPEAHIGYRAPGITQLTITSANEPARILLLGGEPFGESIIMW